MAAQNTVLVTGNTYPVKDQLKALGARWDAAAKGWRVPADKAAEAQALVSGAPAQNRSASRQRRPGRGYGRENCRKYGWDGVVGSSSYYTSGQYDEDS